MKGWFWPPEAVEQLRTMAQAGTSATMAAAQFPGRSRNSVLGVAERNGFTFCGVPGPKAQPKTAKAPKPAPVPKKRVITQQERAQLVAKLEPVEGVLLENIIDGQCMYPVSDTVPFRFCGRNRDRKKGRYCEDHNLIVHQRGQLARL